METINKILKWATNIITIAILGLVLFIIGAHIFSGFPHVINLTITEKWLSLSMGLMFLGAALAFKWRLIGGLVSIISFIVFAIVHGGLMLGFVFYTFLAIGISNIIIYQLNKHK